MRRTGFTAAASTLVRQAPIKPRGCKPKRKPDAEASEWVGEARARDAVAGRSGGLCEIRLRGCFGRALDWHHRLLKGQGGLWQASNGLHLCRWCHEAVTNTRGNRATYEQNGWLIPANTVPAIVPADVPVLLPSGQRVFLDDVGDYLPERGAA